MISKFWEYFRSDDFRDILGYSLAFVFFYYLTIFAFVAPSQELVFAVVIEISVYLTFLIYRLSKRKKVSTHARQIIANTLIDSFPAGSRLRKLMKILVPLALSLALVFSIVDAISFGLAAAGQVKAAQNLYISLPVSTIIGFHPAGSMELLAGANVKAKKFVSAERLYQSLFEIRKRFYGRESEPIADLYADLGNLYAKSKNVSAARDFYLRSILLSKKLKVSQGWGKVLNKLGQLEVEQGNFSVGLAHYKDALKMRERIFGFDHPKVAETLVDMGALHHLNNDRFNEELCVDRARKIIKANQKPEVNSAFIGAFLSLSFFALAYWLTSSNGYLTRLAFLQLQKRLEQIPASEPGERNSMLGLLVILSNFRRLPTLTAQYESEIA